MYVSKLRAPFMENIENLLALSWFVRVAHIEPFKRYEGRQATDFSYAM